MDNQVNSIARGQTFYNGSTIDTSNYGGIHLEGATKVFLDMDPNNIKQLRSQRNITMMLVRNVSGITIRRRALVTWQSGFRGKRVDGYCTTDGQEVAGVVDEFIGTGGVPNGDLFWLCIDGPTLITSPLSGAGFGAASVVIGDVLFALTAVTSQATTAGRFQDYLGTFTAAQATNGYAFNAIKNSFGRAMSAMTSGQTNTDLLVDMKKF